MKKQEKNVDRKQEKFTNERAVFDKPVKAQRGDIFKVIAQGVTIEFTDRYNSAQSAYKDAPKPKQWFKLAKDGSVSCIANQMI